MRYKYNPISDTLDLVDAAGGYIDGEAEYHADLPVTVGTPTIDSAFLVRKGSGLYFISRKPAGIWVRELNNGNLDDWKFAGTFSDLFRDANFRIINDADTSKELAFSLSGIDTATTRTLTVPNASGTLPLLETANTFSANQTLNGTNNTAPNQTAASGSSLMTRDLADARFYGQPEFVTLNLTNFTGATVGGHASGQSSSILTLNGQTNANVISESHARFANFPTINTAGSRNSFNYSRRMRVKLWFGVTGVVGSIPDTKVHYIIPTVSGYTAGQPAHRSFGFVVGATTINGFTHDGTTYATTTTGVVWANNINYYGVLENDGAGNYSFWLNSGSGLTSLGTLTGPTGAHPAEHLFGANTKSTAIDNINFYYLVKSLEISMAAS